MTSALVALTVAIVACISDVRTRRIPNLLTFGAALAALGYHATTGGTPALATAAGGWAVGAALFLPFFLLGGMGAGDVKLLAALGAWIGPSMTLWLAIYTGLAGGVLAVGVALAHGYLRTALRNVRTMVKFWFLTGPRPVPGLTLEQSDAPRLAYAIPVLVGTVVTLWVR